MPKLNMTVITDVVGRKATVKLPINAPSLLDPSIIGIDVAFTLTSKASTIKNHKVIFISAKVALIIVIVMSISTMSRTKNITPKERVVRLDEITIILTSPTYGRVKKPRDFASRGNTPGITVIRWS